MALGYIGDRLGLFKAMADEAPVTSADLAGKTGLNERYVREWLRSMVASEYLDYDTESDRYVMTKEQAFVLANEDSPMFVGGAFHFATPSILNTPRIMDAFRNGGGIPYTEIGEEVPWAIERFFRPGYINFLTKDWLGAVPGLLPRLEKGAKVLDVGCGGGQSTVTMAAAFPNSRIVGIDYHEPSISRARELAAEKGATNVEFVAGPADKIPAGQSYDLICSFDCIHDMVDPLATLKAIRGALSPEGVYIWSEPNASDKAHENRNPVAKVFHAVSPLHCMTVSLAYGGAGLGTVIGEAGARELAEKAGFTSFEKLPIANPFNQFFALSR
jgi:2-polyprenyl-3-methyl-5-hydroxy-6-metoxy-1,4-benzoquinol methylase